MTPSVSIDPVDVVEEMVCGLAAVHADALVRLEGFTVLLHRNIEVLCLPRCF